MFSQVPCLLARKPEFWVTVLVTYAYVDGNLGIEKCLWEGRKKKKGRKI
jgi:hypothetical protein